MAEQWSSKPLMWVRFLLPLIKYNKKILNSFINKNAINIYKSKKFKSTYLVSESILTLNNTKFTTNTNSLYLNYFKKLKIFTPTLNNLSYKLSTDYNSLPKLILSNISVNSLPTKYLYDDFITLRSLSNSFRHNRYSLLNFKSNEYNKYLRLQPKEKGKFFHTYWVYNNNLRNKLQTRLFNRSYLKKNLSNFFVVSKKKLTYKSYSKYKTRRIIFKKLRKMRLIFRKFHKHSRKFLINIYPKVVISDSLSLLPNMYKSIQSYKTSTPNFFNNLLISNTSALVSLLNLPNYSYMVTLNSLLLRSYNQTIHLHSNLPLLAKIQTLSLPLERSNIMINYPLYKNIVFKRQISSSQQSRFLRNSSKWIQSTCINFLEHITGKKVMTQIYSHLKSSVDPYFKLVYSRWAPRFLYYERRLGHRFFLSEALYIMHIGLYDKDSKIILAWAKSMISRISFWKTRVIFRFIRYLFTYFFTTFFPHINAKGFKIKLKGKISIAGNGRKRSILLRFGKTSYSTVDLRTLYSFDTVNTFTGVLGLQVWVFY